MYACSILIAHSDVFFDRTFFQGLLGNGLANVLAVVLGIPAGMYLQHWIASRGSALQRKQMRHAMERALKHNLGSLATIREHLNQRRAFTFNVDLALLDATAHSKYELLNDIELCAGVDHLRFELEHLGRQVDALFKLELDSNARAEGNFVEGRKPSLYSQIQPQLVGSIMAGLPPLEKECQDILVKLNA